MKIYFLSIFPLLNILHQIQNTAQTLQHISISIKIKSKFSKSTTVLQSTLKPEHKNITIKNKIKRNYLLFLLPEAFLAGIASIFVP